MACIYVAFVEGFRLNADFWTAATMDNIIDLANKLVTRSEKLNYKSQMNDYDIIPEIKERSALIEMKLHYSGQLTSQPNIYKALTLYFSKNNACVLCSKDLYLLIWKRCMNFYYIYDPNGRTENCERDFKNGRCALMSTHFIEHLVHLIINIGQTDLKSEFSLYEIVLLNFGKIVEKLPRKPFPKRLHRQWAVINYAYALIPSCNYGLLQPKSADEANSSMLIGVMALLYSYIQRPNTWDTNIVDQIIRIGTAYFKSLRSALHLGKKAHVNIVDVPDKYVLGYYKASIRKNPFFYTGTVTEYCKRFTDSLLACGLRELFSSQWEAALLQIDSSVVAIWRDDCLYYVFDPFRRGRCGQVLESDKVRGLAVVQFHATFESMLRMLYQNSLKMRRGGKFFIHGVNVGCIKPIIDGKVRKLRYTGLKLTPDILEEEEQLAIEQPELSDSDDEKERKKKLEEKKRKKMLKKMNKKQRDAFLKKEKKLKKEQKKKEQQEKKEKKKFEKMCASKKGLTNKKCYKVCSITVVPKEERLAPFDDSELVEALLDDIICEIIDKFSETSAMEKQRLFKCANRVLLQSDKEYLENLKYMVNRDLDFDNYDDMNKQRQQDQDEFIPTLEDELAIPSNFRSLPDGSWVLFGNEIIQRLDDDKCKLYGFLSSLVTAALTTRYKISTWNETLIDFAIKAVDTFGEEFEVYQYALGAFFTKRLPRISIGKYEYEIRIKRIIKSDLQKSLREVLLESLISNTRIFVICQRFSALIIKRYNFLYMFVGFSVNQVGYRKMGSGPACVLRFIELDSLIRRIEYGCNPMGCDICDYIVVNLQVVDVSPFGKQRYKPYPPDVDQHIYNLETQRMRKAQEGKMAKLRFLDGEIDKENKRIREFMKAKQEHIKRKTTCKRRGRRRRAGGSEEMEEEYEDFLEEMVEEEEEDACDISPKHEFGRKMDKLREALQIRPVLYGYRLREKDYLYKIQGSKALDGRSESVSDEIKPCFFASTLAILYAILKPLNQWTSQRVDQLIDNANLLSDKITDMCTAYERTIRNINVDDYTFDILIRVYEPMGMGLQLERQLEQGTSVRKYLLLHTANCTYAIFRDEYFHLFDPYPSMETSGDDDEEEDAEEDKQKPKRPKSLKGIRKYGERNTASWVLFADLEAMLEYMDKRAGSQSWKEDHEYTFHVIDVIAYRKSSKNAQVLQLLTGMAPCAPGDVKEAALCAHNETIGWIEQCLPIWSRLNRRNAAGRYRNMGISKFKKYDIEIQDRLWSLWGTLHPNAPVFESASRGKQFLACSIVAIGAAHMYRMIDWTPQLLDSIIINGDRYHQQSLSDIKCENYQFSIEDLNLECWLDSMRFMVHVEHVIYGTLYCRPSVKRMNLSNALMYFFTYYRFGILQCFNKCLAIGYIPGFDGGYFMYDCQSRENPLYPKGQGSSYILRTYHLQVLLYCIIVTLNVPYYNVLFTIHKVEMIPEGASLEDDNNNDEARSEEV